MLTLTKEESAFLIVCLINLLIAVCYLLWGCFIYVPGKKLLNKDDACAAYDNRRTFLIRFVIMLLCPVIGPCFFLMGWLTCHIFFHQKVDLSDVFFSKERSRQYLKDDEEKERNMASMEETLIVGDDKDQRSLMMSVIQRDLDNSLSSVVLALDSEDSETSHYAASALQDFFNDFRIQTRRLSAGIEKESEEESECEELLIDYMKAVLTQKIFTGIEQKRYVEIFEGAGEKLYKKNAERFTPERYEAIVLCLLEQEDFEKAAIWCERMMQQFPEELLAYKCKLKLYYKTKDHDMFFDLLEDLKHQSITLDSETIEIIRVFR